MYLDQIMPDSVKAKDIILETDTPNLFLLPSHLDLVGAEIELINHPNREKILKEILITIMKIINQKWQLQPKEFSRNS